MPKLLLLPAIGIPAVVVAAALVAGAPSVFRDDSESIPDAASDSCAAEEQSAAQESPLPRPQISDATPQPTGRLQSAEEAVAQDLALAAESRGWTIEEEAAHVRGGDILGKITAQVAAQRPEIYVGAALSSEPLGPPTLYIKGPADDFIRDLVAGAEIEIRIVDNQPFSAIEIEERQTHVSRALQALGFRNAAVGSTMTEGGRIEAEVTRQHGVTDNPVEILAAIPAEVRNSVTVTVHDAPVAVPDEAEACAGESSGSPDQAAQRDFGPLAVIDAGGGDAAHGGTGPIDIGENCVTMPLPNGETLLLVWHAKEVQWNEDTGEITYRLGGRPESKPITIRHGDVISVGGSGLEAWQVASLTWVAKPHPSCSGEPWSVTIFR